MKAVVLGGSGFIGRSLVERLRHESDQTDITVFDRAESDDSRSRVHHVQGDFAAGVDFTSLVRGADLVVHLISTSVPGNEKDALQEVYGNVIPSIELFEACAACGVGRVVFLSSGGTVYGTSGRRLNKETDLPDPMNTYGLQKLMIEDALRMICHTSPMEYQIIRLSNPYGPGQNPRGPLGLITKLVYQAMRGETVHIFGDGSVVRDFIYIDDAIEGIADVIGRGDRNSTYNIGRGVGVSVAQVVQTLQRVLPEGLKVAFDPPRNVDVPYSVLDIAKYLEISSLDGFISLDDGIMRTYAYFKEPRP